jgi:hypothetical protein
MDFGDFGLREVIWLALAAAAVYLVVSLRGLLRLTRRPAAVPAAGIPDLTFIAADGLRKPSASAPTPPEPQLADTPNFSQQLSVSALAAEVRELRAEVAALREEIEAERRPRPVSPFYGEAMDLAARGYDARGISDECGISVAEAELLLAMSRRRETPEQGGNDDGIWRGRAISGR